MGYSVKKKYMKASVLFLPKKPYIYYQHRILRVSLNAALAIGCL